MRLKPTLYGRQLRDYPILFAKTGSGDGYNTLLVVTMIKKHLVAAVIMDALNSEARFIAMRELLDIVDGKFDNKINKTMSVQSALCACAYSFDNARHNGVCVYEKNADKCTAPMSVTKVMTQLIVNRYLYNKNKKVIILPEDVLGTEGTSGDLFKSWYRVRIDDLISAMMISSSNQAANTLARIVGEKIIREKNENRN